MRVTLADVADRHAGIHSRVRVISQGNAWAGLLFVPSGVAAAHGVGHQHRRRRRRADSGVDDHPALMPMTLARWCVTIASEPGDVPLRPLHGVGTTLLAAWGLEPPLGQHRVESCLRRSDRAAALAR